MSVTDIFISYSRNDRETARRYAEALTDEGFKVWWDAALRPGETFDEVIETELRASKAVVVLWSPHSVASRWVRAEATLADRRNKLIPIIVEACDLPIIFELMHTTDLSDWDGDTTAKAWRMLVADLKRQVGEDREDTASRASNGSKLQGFGRANVSAMPSAAASSAQSRPAISALDDDSDDGSEDTTRYYTRSDGFGALADRYHCLELKIGDELEKSFVVSPMGIRIGRSAPADVVLSDSRVSRLHCLVELADDRLRVSDLKSTNGTFIDGERIEGIGLLEVGSVLRVGNIRLTHSVRALQDVKAA